jgi:hypothetical protein
MISEPVRKALEEIDAAIFSSDDFLDLESSKEFMVYWGRWGREVASNLSAELAEIDQRLRELDEKEKSAKKKKRA